MRSKIRPVYKKPNTIVVPSNEMPKNLESDLPILYLQLELLIIYIHEFELWRLGKIDE
jgi:hypothetical protein